MSRTRTTERPPLLRKQYALTIDEVKEAGEGDAGLGSFTGAASVYNVIDLHGDVIVPGAFDQTLRDKGPERVLLYQHDMHRPIGLAKFGDSANALLTEGVPNAEVRDAREAMALVKQRAIKGLSIGFNITGEEWDGGIRHITGVDLWEVSIVTFPANPLANITEAKSAQDALTELRARQVLSDAADHLKAGKVLSKANRTLVEQAYEALGALLEAAREATDDAADGGKAGEGDTLQEKGGAMDVLLADIRSHRRR